MEKDLYLNQKPIKFIQFKQEIGTTGSKNKCKLKQKTENEILLTKKQKTYDKKTKSGKRDKIAFRMSNIGDE